MPVTKSAKRALRGSAKKRLFNKLTMSKLEAAIRAAKNSKASEKILKAMSLADKTVKKRVIHKNKAARIKSQLSKLLPKATKSKRKAAVVKAKPTAKAKLSRNKS